MSEFDDWWEKHYSMANLARGAAEDAWNAAVAHERERCAKIADAWADECATIAYAGNPPTPEQVSRVVASLIREGVSRRNKQP